jgi:hypothetical protein
MSNLQYENANGDGTFTLVLDQVLYPPYIISQLDLIATSRAKQICNLKANTDLSATIVNAKATGTLHPSLSKAFLANYQRQREPEVKALLLSLEFDKIIENLKEKDISLMAVQSQTPWDTFVTAINDIGHQIGMTRPALESYNHQKLALILNYQIKFKTNAFLYRQYEHKQKAAAAKLVADHNTEIKFRKNLEIEKAKRARLSKEYQAHINKVNPPTSSVAAPIPILDPPMPTQIRRGNRMDVEEKEEEIPTLSPDTTTIAALAAQLEELRMDLFALSKNKKPSKDTKTTVHKPPATAHKSNNSTKAPPKNSSGFKGHQKPSNQAKSNKRNRAGSKDSDATEGKRGTKKPNKRL